MKKTALLALCLLIVCSCQTANSLQQRQIYVFGTLVDISIWHGDKHQTELAFDAIDDLFKNMHHQWHAWKPGRLTDINNALRHGDSIQLTPAEATFMQQVIDLSRQSDYYFNPAIGELIHLWGFHTDDYPITSPPPKTESIQFLANQNITVDNLHLDGFTLRADNRHVWLDFGGIAKGLAVDLAVAIIRDLGIHNAIVNAGGDLRSIGQKGNRAWRIGIQSPHNREVIAELKIDADDAVFTSGNYQRYKEFNGTRYAHIINGATGQPVQDIISVTVIASDGVTADAAATALSVAGSQHWQHIAKRLHLDKVLMIDSKDHCQTTQAMADRMLNSQLNCDIKSVR